MRHVSAAPIPVEETARLAALDASALLGTPDEYPLDCITNIGTRLFDVPVCLLSLMDADRQWFKSCVGLDVRETPRKIAFCNHVIASGEPVIVEDAVCDARFADNPLVLSAPKIRFYAGHPVRAAGGEILGTLCLIDFKPRQFPADLRRHLRELAFLAEISLAARTISAGQKALVAKLAVARRESLIDSMLRIWNRGGISAVIDHQYQYSRDSNSPFSLLMIDVDHFKQVNDRHGHLIGDSVLKAVTRALRSSLRAGDDLGRYGGEEFMVILPDTKAAAAEHLAHRLREAVASATTESTSGPIRCTVSIGVAELKNAPLESVKSLIHRADDALLLAKQLGRNRVHSGEQTAIAASALEPTVLRR